MSLLPAKTQGEGIWQYCNYGYDPNKYSSYADCMDKRCKEAGLGSGFFCSFWMCPEGREYQ